MAKPKSAQTTVDQNDRTVVGTDMNDPTSPEAIGPRTGPNVDAGLEPGVVTVDPQTPAGVAAENARKANGAKTHEEDQEVIGSVASLDPKAQVVETK